MKMPLLTSHGFTYIFDCVIKELEDGGILPSTGAFCAFLRKKKASMFRNYVAVRNSAKLSYMQNPKGLLDRHKCAAAFMMAFLSQTALESRNVYKEKVAILIGLYILKIFINSPNDGYGDPVMATHIEINDFRFPKCKHDEGLYVHNWALGIHYDYMESKLSVLSLANALFMVEMYNRQIAGLED